MSGISLRTLVQDTVQREWDVFETQANLQNHLSRIAENCVEGRKISLPTALIGELATQQEQLQTLHCRVESAASALQRERQCEEGTLATVLATVQRAEQFQIVGEDEHLCCRAVLLTSYSFVRSDSSGKQRLPSSTKQRS